EHRVVARLAGVARDRPALCDAVDRQAEVEFARRAAGECATKLEVEDGGAILGEGPSGNRKISACAGDRGFRGAPMVGMTGDAALVEDKEQVGVASFDHCLDICTKGV